VVLSLAALVFLGRHWLNKHYDLASQEVTSTTQTLLNQKKVNDDNEKKYTDLQQEMQTVIAALQQQNSQLAQQAASAYQQAINQKSLDEKLSNQQLANRIEQLSNQKNVQSTDQGVQLNHDQSVGVTQQLEDVPMLKTQLGAERIINANNLKQIAGITDELNQCNQLNTGLKTQLQDQKKADEAELKKAKIASLRSKFKWFGVGFITGFITGHVY